MRKSESSTGGRSTRDDNSADSSPHRSVSAAEETDSEDEDSGIKPRGMSCITRKAPFRVSDQVGHKLDCTTTVAVAD